MVPGRLPHLAGHAHERDVDAVLGKLGRHAGNDAGLVCLTHHHDLALLRRKEWEQGSRLVSPQGW